MSATQQEAIDWLQSTVGQHLDYDNAQGQQCVDYFNFFYRRITGRDPFADGLHSPRVDYARQLWDVRMGDFTYIPDSASLKPQPGDILIYGPGWGLGAGHVEVVVANDEGGCTIVGENEHGNKYEGVVRVYRTWAQMRGLLGVMRLNWYVAPPSSPYTISAMEPKQVHVTANKYKWNLAQPNWDAVCNNPITSSGGGLDFTAVATLTRSDAGFQNYTYYLDDANTPHGWNSVDCSDIAPPTAMPAPYVPPAAPVPVAKAERYEVFTTLPVYASDEEVAQAKNPIDIIQPGVYYVWQKKGTTNNYWDLSTSNMEDQNKWINIIDNKKPLNPAKPSPKPKPTPAHTTTNWQLLFTPFPDGKSRRYFAQRDMYLPDLAATQAKGINIDADEMVPMYGSVTKEGMTYLIPRLLEDTVEGQIAPKEHYYGIPTTSIYTGLPNMKSQQYIDALAQAEVENRVYRKSVHHETTEDKVYYAEQIMARAVKDGICFIDGIIGPKGFAKIKAAIGRRDNKK